MSNSTEIWKMVVTFKEADSISICATEHACKTAYNEWADATSQFDTEGTAADLIEITGVTDTADQAPIKTGFLRSGVKAISVLRMY
jgi:hypothetical protein